MASGWMKSLQCKSKALDDVVDVNPDHHNNRRRRHHHRSLSNSSSCRSSYQNLKDIVETNKKPKLPKKPKPPNPHPSPPPPFKSRKPEPGPNHPARSSSIDSFFSSLMELPSNHPSRNVVEIIFHTSWGEKNFSGQIEMVFKVQNLTRTLNRFEEYRDSVKLRAGCTAAGTGSEDHVRCNADGNEVMRFYCLGATPAGGAWGFQGGKRAAVCTYSGSGVAHESAGGGRGRRAMLVCRVIAGRVCNDLGSDSLIQERVGFDSVGGEKGELLVFDTRALLPCFLIIYKL